MSFVCLGPPLLVVWLLLLLSGSWLPFFINYLFKTEEWSQGLAQCVKWLLHTHQDWTMIPSVHIKAGQSGPLWPHCSGKEREKGPWSSLVSLSSLISKILPSYPIKWKVHEMAQWVKRLPHRYKDLSSDPRNPHKARLCSRCLIPELLLQGKCWSQKNPGAQGSEVQSWAVVNNKKI